MRSEFLPFSRPSISEEEIGSIAAVLSSGWITTGSRCSEFERRFSDYAGCRGAVALSSATAGMHLLLHALGIGPRDEVITPSITMGLHRQPDRPGGRHTGFCGHR